MPQIDLHSHPFTTTKRLLRLVNSNATLRFSIYNYVPQSLSDDRRLLTIKSKDLSEEWILSTIQQLDPSEELAFHSRITIGKSDFHIPMIDFVGLGPDHFTGLTSVFGDTISEEFDFYRSGRSFHAYGRELPIPHSEWVKFMGKLLLCNINNKPLVVDQRWVGHRLIAGYSALRWSCNSKRHQMYPTIVENMAEISRLNRREKLYRLDP